MSKTINNFFISLAILVFALFGFSACKGPLDDLKVDISGQGVTEVDGGYETTLELGDETTDRLTVRAEVSGAGGDVSKQVLWNSSDNNKVQVTDVKKVGDYNFATVVGKNVTQNGKPVKIVVSSIEKTKANVTLFVNVVSKATKVLPRDNTAIAVKGSVYEPNVLDFFTFANDNDQTNVTIPDYDYTLTVTTTTGEEIVLEAGARIPLDAQSLSVKFAPTDKNYYKDSEIYTTQVLEVPSQKIILYESLENADFELMTADTNEEALNENGVFELVINKDNGQNHNYKIAGFNPQTMNLVYNILPSGAEKYINVDFDATTGELSFMGQEETGTKDVSLEFVVTYKDRSISSTGRYIVPFSVVSYPEIISINGHTAMDEEVNLTVYDRYLEKMGETLVISLSPYSSLFENVTIKLKSDVDDKNLAWYLPNVVEPVSVGSNGLTVKSGTRLYLRNIEKDGSFGSGTISYVVSATGTNVEKVLNVTLDFGVEQIFVDTQSTKLDSTTHNFVLSIKTKEDTSTVVTNPTEGEEQSGEQQQEQTEPQTDVRSIKLKTLPASSKADVLLDSFVVANPRIVEVLNPREEGDGVMFDLNPLSSGITTITWAAPTGATYTQTVEVFEEFYEYSIDVIGQQDVVGQIKYKTESEPEEGQEPVYVLDKNNNRVISSMIVATSSVVDVATTLSPAKAKIERITYRIENENVVSYMAQTSDSFTQLRTGSVAGTTDVVCYVYYYVLDSGEKVLRQTTYLFTVKTYYKAKSLQLSDTSIILYTSSGDSSDYVYNAGISQKRVSLYVETDGGESSVVLDEAVWTAENLAGGTLSITAPITKSNPKYGEYYGAYIDLTALGTPPNQSMYITTIRVSVSDFNVTLVAELSVTIYRFQAVSSATMNTSDLSGFVVTKNTQSQQNTSSAINRTVELYIEKGDVTDDTYFGLEATVSPTRATNKNLQYIIFDYDSVNGELNSRSGEYYDAINHSYLISIENGQIKVNYDIDSSTNPSRKIFRSGRAVIYVLAEDSMKKFANDISSFSDIEMVGERGLPILLKIEIIVADGQGTAYRIYDASDFVKIFASSDSNFEVMNDIYGVDLSDAISNSGIYAPVFSGKLKAANDIVRTITFKNITITRETNKIIYNNVEITAEESTGDTNLASAILGKFSGTVSNLNFVISKYTYATDGTTTPNEIAILADVLAGGKIENVTLNVGEFVVTSATGEEGGVLIGAITTNEGTINNLSVVVSNAIINVNRNATISLGVVENEGSITGISVRGNVGVGGSEAYNFGGAIGENAGTIVGATSMANLVSLQNQNLSYAAFQYVGGVVGTNSGSITDARYEVVKTSAEQLDVYGIEVKSALNSQNVAIAKIGGVVGTNSGTIDYAYATSFVAAGKISSDAGIIAGVAGDNTGTISKVFANIALQGTNLKAIANGEIQDYYYTGIVFAYIPDGGLGKDHDEFWGTNSTYVGGYYDNLTHLYHYLIKDGKAYLPNIPSSINTAEYNILEFVGASENDLIKTFTFNKYITDLTTATSAGEWSCESTLYPTFNLFGGTLSTAETQQGILSLTFPPVDYLDELFVYVELSGDSDVVKIVEGVNASQYKIMIVGRGTAKLKVVSMYNEDALCEVQICVLDGFANFEITDIDGNSPSAPITVKKDIPEQFVVVYKDNQNAELNSNFINAAQQVSGTGVLVEQNADTFIITGNTQGDNYKISLQKILRAKFFNSNTSSVYNINSGSSTEIGVKVKTGPTSVDLSHGDMEVYAGDHIFTTVTVSTDDAFDGDSLKIYAGNVLIASINKNAQVEIVDADYVVKCISATCDYEKAIFELEYYLADPASITQDKKLNIIFEATTGVESSYNLTIMPQPITSIDMYHYIDVVQVAETGELAQAGKTPTANIVSGSFGLLKVTVDPYYVDFDRIEVRSDILSGGFGVTFDQRVFDTDNNLYVLLSDANVSVTSNSISTKSRRGSITEGVLNDFDGTFYFRTFLPATTPSNSVFNIYVTVYGADGTVMISQQKRYTTYMPSELSLAYDNYISEQNVAYIAQNTGGYDENDIYGQNSNILTVKVQSGLIDPTLSVVEFDENGKEIPASGATLALVDYQSASGSVSQAINLANSAGTVTKRYYVINSGYNLGDTFIVRLSANTYVSGVLTTITREMKFQIVDFVVNNQFANPQNSYLLSGQYAQNKSVDAYKSFAGLGGAISDVSGSAWSYVFSTTKVQLSAFATAKRGNLALTSDNYQIDRDGSNNVTDATKLLLRSIPEFSFAYTDTNIKNVVKYIQNLNYYGMSGDQQENSTETQTTTSLHPFLYQDGNNFIAWPTGDTESVSGVTLQLGTNDNGQDHGNYYIKGEKVSANTELRFSTYVHYVDGKFKTGTSTTSILLNKQFHIEFNEQNSDEHPIPVYTLADLKKMEAGYSYILMNDINLNEITQTRYEAFAPLTTAIASLDGNNYKIVLKSVENSPIFNTTSTNGEIGLFATVNENTILKNLTIELQSNCIVDLTALASCNFGLLAGTNNGAITNCKVVSNSTDPRKTLTIASKQGDNVNFGGLVGTNDGYITNSRVYNINFGASYGRVGGFVAENERLISACYVDNTTITYDVVQELDGLTMLGGFVAQNTNEGQIFESYVGDLVNIDDQITENSRSVTISSNSKFGAFVYENSAEITDCYATADLNNRQTAVASGFVYTNQGNISRCYSASMPTVSTNTFIRPFVGTSQNSGVTVANNSGTIENCIYFKDVYNNYQQSYEVATSAGIRGMTENARVWPTYSFASNNNEGGVWTALSQTTLGPKLVNPSIMGITEELDNENNLVHQTIESIENTSSGAVYNYTCGVKYNTKDYVDLISSAEEFNNIFEKIKSTDVCASDADYYARIIKPIDLSILGANNIELKTITKVLRGKIVGNNLTISGIDISYLDKVSSYDSSSSVIAPTATEYQNELQTQSGENSTENNSSQTEQATQLATESQNSVGLFGEIRGGTVSNLNMEVVGVYANNKTRVYVGTVAGRIIDGSIYNLNIIGEEATVLGYNIVGGAAGIVLGQSRVSNITVSELSVTSDFEHDGATEEKKIYNFDLMRMSNATNMELSSASELSVAGGVVGILDLYNYEISSNNNNINYTIKINEENYFSTTLLYEGNNTVLGQIVGGVVGVVGSTTKLSDVRHTISTNSRLKASVYAGGLVGQNNGSLSYGIVEYTNTIQQLVNAANTGEIVASANDKLFDTIGYTAAVGGIVGANFGQTYNNYQTGALRFCSSSIYVNAPNAQNVGGVVGVVYGGDIRAVYATGYVLGYTTGSVGGLIGTINKVEATSNINKQLNIPDSLLVNVKNPYTSTSEQASYLVPGGASQKVLIDFAVAQNNWASAYYNTYTMIKRYGHLGGFIGYLSDDGLLITSHNAENWDSYVDANGNGINGYTEDMTVVINYYVNKIPQSSVAVNQANYNGLSIFATNIEVENADQKTEEQIEADIEQKTSHYAVGGSRNFAYSSTKWDWFALWDEYSIAGRNLDDTPILQYTTPDPVYEIYSTKDFLKMYWHPEENFILKNDINFITSDDKQVQYIMAGSATTPFSGTFDGQGYTISNLYVSNYLSDIGGLFGYVAGKSAETPAAITNVILDGVTISNTHTVESLEQINNPETRSMGALVGYIANHAKITNVVVTNANISYHVQNTNSNFMRYVGGIAGYTNKTNFNNVGVEGIEDGITIIQSGIAAANNDTLFVGGFAGKMDASTVTRGTGSSTGLLNVSNIKINNTNITNNTFYGGAVGGINKSEFDTFVSSGDHTFNGTVGATLTASGIFGIVEGNGNNLKASYAYSTLRVTDLSNATEENVTLYYDFNEDAKITIPAAKEEIILEQTQENEQQTDNQESTEQQTELTACDKVFSAVSIISNIGETANKNITRYQQTVIDNDNNQTLYYYIPLDPYYSLATYDEYYDITQDDLTNGKEFYDSFLVFDATTGENTAGYKRDANSNIEATLLANVFNKIQKLYYNNGRITYGGAKILSNAVDKIEDGEYYIIPNRLGVDMHHTLEYVNGFVNGHNFPLRIDNTTSFADNVLGVITGVELHFLNNAFNLIDTENTWDNSQTTGVLANALNAGGVVNACGTVANESFNSKKIAEAIISLGSGAFGGLVGENSGLINNCWSHIKYYLNTTNESVFGGIVGEAKGGTIANVNYYGNITGLIDSDASINGIIGKTEAQTTLYKVMSYIFVFNGNYHIAKNENLTLVDDFDEDQNNPLETVYYFSMSSDGSDAVGTKLGFFNVFDNLAAESSIFRKYYGIWDEEIDGFNMGLPTLKIEPKVESTDGRDENNAIEIPNEEYFAEMLQYEASKKAGRYYKLTKGDSNSGETDTTYYLDKSYKHLYQSATDKTTIADGTYSGHLNGNNKILLWETNTRAVPLFDSMVSPNTVDNSKVDYSISPYITNLTIKNEATGIPNLIANSITTGTLRNITVVSEDITIDTGIQSGDFGIMVGLVDSNGTIEDCEIKNVNIILDGDGSKQQNIGFVSGTNKGIISKIHASGSITGNGIIKDDSTIGGLVGANEGQIGSVVNTQSISVSSNTLLVVVDTGTNEDKATINTSLSHSTFVLNGTNFESSSEGFTLNSYTLFSDSGKVQITDGDVKVYRFSQYNAELAKVVGTDYREATESELTNSNITKYVKENSVYREATSQECENGNITKYVKESNIKLIKLNNDRTLTWITKELNDCFVLDGQYVLLNGTIEKFTTTIPMNETRIWSVSNGTTVYYYNTNTGESSSESFDSTKYVLRVKRPNVKAFLTGGTLTTYNTIQAERGTLDIKFVNKDGAGSDFVYAVFGDLDDVMDCDCVLKHLSEMDEEFAIDGKKAACYTVLVGEVQFNKFKERITFTVGGHSFNVGDDPITMKAKNNGASAYTIVTITQKSNPNSQTAETVYIQVNINTPKANNVGGVAGTNIGLIGDIMVLANTIVGNQYVGGIVGANKGTIDYAMVQVTTLTGESSYVGGVAGINGGKITKPIVQDTNITANDTDSFVGGIAGSNQNSEIQVARIKAPTITNLTITGKGNSVSAITGYNNGDIVVGENGNNGILKIDSVTLNVTSYKKDVTGTDPNTLFLYSGFITSQNFGSITFGGYSKNTYNLLSSEINLNFELRNQDNNIYNPTSYSTEVSVGGLVGINYGSIENVLLENNASLDFEVTFETANVNNKLYVGGVAGTNNASGSIRDLNVKNNGYFVMNINVNNENVKGNYKAATSDELNDSNITKYVIDASSYRVATPSDIMDSEINKYVYIVAKAQLGGVVGYNEGFVSGKTSREQSPSIKSNITLNTTQNSFIKTTQASLIGGVVGVNGGNGVVYNLTYAGSRNNDVGGVDAISNAESAGGIVAENYGLVMNCSLTNASIASADGSANTGGIVGRNKLTGVVSGCAVSTNSSVRGWSNVGGLVGQNEGRVTSSQTYSTSTNISAEDEGFKLVATNTNISTTNNVNLQSASAKTKGSYKLKINSGSGYTSEILIMAGTTQTTTNGMKIKFLTDAQVSFGKIEKDVEYVCSGANIKYNSNALVQYSRPTEEGTTYTIEYTDAEVYVSGTNLGLDGTATVDGMLDVQSGSTINLSAANTNQGVNVTTLPGNVTTTSTQTEVVSTVIGQIVYPENTYVKMLSGSQTYLQDTTSYIQGDVRHTSNTTVGILGYETYPNGAVINYEAGTYLDVELTQELSLALNNTYEFIYDDNINAINEAYTIGSTTYTATAPDGIKKLYVDNQVVIPGLAYTPTGSETYVINGIKYFEEDETTPYSMTVTDGTENEKTIYNDYNYNVGANETIKIYLQYGGTVIYGQETKVRVYKEQQAMGQNNEPLLDENNDPVMEEVVTTQTYVGDTTSTIDAQIQHNRYTKITAPNNKQFTEGISVPNNSTVAIYYNNAKIGKSLDKCYNLYGTETFETDSYIYSTKDLTTISGVSVQEGVYVNDEEGFRLASEEEIANAGITKYNLYLVAANNTISLSQSVAISDTNMGIAYGTELTYNNVNVTYNQKTTSQITGTIIYNQNGQAIYVAGTGISYSKTDDQTVTIGFITGGTIRVNEGEITASGITYTANQEVIVNANHSIKIESNNVSITFNTTTTVAYACTSMANGSYTPYSVTYNGQIVTHPANQTVNVTGDETFLNATNISLSGVAESTVSGSIYTELDELFTQTPEGARLYTETLGTGRNINIYGHNNIGGAIGYNNNGLAENVKISSVKIYTKGGSSRDVGGFVGYGLGTYKLSANQYSVNFKNCEVSDITIKKASDNGSYAIRCGGFAGHLKATSLERCIVTGSLIIEAGYNIGGLVGQAGEGHNSFNFNPNTQVILNNCGMSIVKDSHIRSYEKNNASWMDYEGSMEIDLNTFAGFIGFPWSTPTNDTQNLGKIVGHDPIPGSQIDNMDKSNYKTANLQIHINC